MHAHIEDGNRGFEINMFSMLRIEPSGELTTHLCECCGDVTATAWGEVWCVSGVIAIYRARWTECHVEEYGACFYLILGPWGDGKSKADRTLVRLEHRLGHTGASVMVQDAALVDGLEAVAGRALARSDIIGTPRAAQIFAIYDAIVTQDTRLTPLMTGDN